VPQAAWLASCLPRARAFRAAAREPLADVEWRVLGEILRRNRDTAFGRQHGFSRIASVEEFRRAVPVADYRDLAPFIDRAAAGEAGVLTAEPVRLFEVTSGTSGGSKLIPTTAGLQEAFNRALHPWMIDLFRHHPGLWGGPAYWVVSPRDTGRRTAGGIPIGFAEDAEYFGRWGRLLLEPMMAVPGWLGRAPDIQSWRYLSLLALLRADGLRFISLWNPTFLPLLLSHLGELGEALVSDLERGGAEGAPQPAEASWPASLPSGASIPDRFGESSVPGSVPPRSPHDRDTGFPGGQGSAPESARESGAAAGPLSATRPTAGEDFASAVARAFAGAPRPDLAARLRDLLPAIRRGEVDGLGLRLWPRLSLISTWTDGEAASCLGEVRRWFPDVAIQGKGLLATEGMVTVPLAAAPAPVLTVLSGFYEFQEGADGETPIRRAGEVRSGERYRVIMTTPGGLYRYRLHDLVECRGFWRSLPMFRFLGKTGAVGDLRGEKLEGGFVAAVLARVLPGDHGGFVAPCQPTTGSPEYVLHIPGGGQVHDPAALAAAIEEGLRANMHYAWARDLGQLAPFRVEIHAADRFRFLAWRLERRAARGGAASTAKFPLFEPGLPDPA